ncbi:unnamed protein product [Effrenium voratum]|nr:unnamed protein product [Effrenium voratum]
MFFRAVSWKVTAALDLAVQLPSLRLQPRQCRGGVLQRVAETAAPGQRVADATRIISAVGNWKWALAVHYLQELLQQVTPDVVCFTAAVGVCSRASRWRQGIQLLRQMQQVQVEPNVVSYNSAIAGCGRAGRWQIVLHLLEEMSAAQLQADAVTYNTAMVALRVGGQSRRVLRMPRTNAEADAFTYCAMVSACKEQAKWAKVLSLLKDMPVQGIDEYVLSAAIAACARGMQPKQALDLLRLGGDDSVVVDAAVAACAGAALWAEAIGLLGKKPGVQSLVGAALAAAGASRNHLAALVGAAQRAACQELMKHPEEEGAWHDAILAEGLAHNLHFSSPGTEKKTLASRTQLLRVLRPYVIEPLVALLVKPRSRGFRRQDILQGRFGFGGFGKEALSELRVEPTERLDRLQEWPRHSHTAAEPVARSMSSSNSVGPALTGDQPSASLGGAGKES